MERFKECFGDLCASRNLVHGFNAQVDVHLLHHNRDGDHKGRVKSGSVMVRLLFRADDSRQRGYLKADEDNFNF